MFNKKKGTKWTDDINMAIKNFKGKIKFPQTENRMKRKFYRGFSFLQQNCLLQLCSTVLELCTFPIELFVFYLLAVNCFLFSFNIIYFAPFLGVICHLPFIKSKISPVINFFFLSCLSLGKLLFLLLLVLPIRYPI